MTWGAFKINCLSDKVVKNQNKKVASDRNNFKTNLFKKLVCLSVPIRSSRSYLVCRSLVLVLPLGLLVKLSALIEVSSTFGVNVSGGKTVLRLNISDICNINI